MYGIATPNAKALGDAVTKILQLPAHVQQQLNTDMLNNQYIDFLGADTQLAGQTYAEAASSVVQAIAQINMMPDVSADVKTQLNEIQAAIEGNIDNLIVGDDNIIDTEQDIITVLPEGKFDIIKWDGYPNGVKPIGPFLILEGEVYQVARKEANNFNAKLHRENPALIGKQIHEIHPIKFGGSPYEISNKIVLSPKEHAKYTVWWNRLLREINKDKGE